jgi:hypothetical protein
MMNNHGLGKQLREMMSTKIAFLDEAQNSPNRGVARDIVQNRNIDRQHLVIMIRQQAAAKCYGRPYS